MIKNLSIKQVALISSAAIILLIAILLLLAQLLLRDITSKHGWEWIVVILVGSGIFSYLILRYFLDFFYLSKNKTGL